MAAPALGVRRRFVPSSASVDWSHPLAQGLQFCGVSSLGLDLAKNRIGSVSGHTNTSSVYGPTKLVSWTNAQTTDLAFTSGPYTIATASVLSANNTYYASMDRSVYVSESNSQGWAMQSRPNSDARPGLSSISLRNNSVANYVIHTGTLAPLGSYVHLVRSNGSNLRELFVDGLRRATNANNANPVSSSANLTMTVTSFTVTLGLCWSRSLSDNEIAMLTADPFCFLRY